MRARLNETSVVIALHVCDLPNDARHRCQATNCGDTVHFVSRACVTNMVVTCCLAGRAKARSTELVPTSRLTIGCKIDAGDVTIEGFDAQRSVARAKTDQSAAAQ